MNSVTVVFDSKWKLVDAMGIGKTVEGLLLKSFFFFAILHFFNVYAPACHVFQCF